ncbi:hypothetical protein [Burkholderia sp. S-53]|uniref:hypothetical protein n=1 Tax=Burkholderia sp. S-53 TaxID=2906514 RepID=UPI0021CFAE2B|nr:hypothetical protein [Burkholderia sp. S-53]UXU85619.1 hypothetical protein LXM88_04435 [Burkholderia sp. S-53]
MNFTYPAIVSALLMLTAGCSTVPQSFQLTATPLMKASDALAAVAAKSASGGEVGDGRGTPPQSLSNFQAVNLLVQDSESRCADFVNSLFSQMAGSGFAFDVLGTISSALATVFTPLTVVHSLTAGSTVFGAAKTGISANYLNTLSISHVAQSIQSTYQADIQKYIGYLNGLDQNGRQNIDVYAERSVILSYHNECSLAWAEGTISVALQPPQSEQSTGSGGQSISVKYTVPKAGQAVAAVADGVASAVAASSDFQKANVTATSKNGIVTFAMRKTFPLDASARPGKPSTQVAVNNDSSPVTLTISGKPAGGDVITITGTPTSPGASKAGTGSSSGTNAATGGSGGTKANNSGISVRPSAAVLRVPALR